MRTASLIDEFLGAEYAHLGRGPAYDCLGLVLAVQKRLGYVVSDPVGAYSPDWADSDPVMILNNFHSYWEPVKEPKIGDAVAQVVSGRYQSASAVFMHPRRWAWMLAALGTDGRPLIAATAGSGPVNAMGVGSPNGYGDGTAGTLFGLPVITDANIGTTLGAGTEDLIIIGRPSDWHLYENGDGSPQMLRFDAPNAGSLSIKLTVHGFAALAAGRQPESIATITGTGLAAPAFA